jgi:hypothetical protein
MVTVKDNEVYFKGRPLNNASAERILDLAKMGLPVTSEINCLVSLLRHDDPRVIDAFEDFLQTWDIPRLEDGRVVLFKAVNDDFTAIHDNTTDWSVGREVSEDWANVDRNPDNTCSRGLHACPLKCVDQFWNASAKVIELHVWPEDFAALPTDYTSNGKVRLVRAYVAREVPREWVDAANGR